MIADPYFAVYDLFAFGHATRSPDAELKILGSALRLKKGDTGPNLKMALEQTFLASPLRPEVRLLLGDPPPLHDRFLVIDDDVWLSGNSLHTLGERAGMVVRLPDPEPIVGHLGQLWDDATSIDEWVEGRIERRPRMRPTFD